MTRPTALRIVRVSAAYDLIVTLAFALPITAPALFSALGIMHANLNLAGSVPRPDDIYAVMFANLMGSLVIAWSVFRIVRPSLAAGAADVGARLLFAIGMLAALLHGASPIVAVMFTLELAWAAVQGIAVFWAWRTGRKAHSGIPLHNAA